MWARALVALLVLGACDPRRPEGPPASTTTIAPTPTPLALGVLGGGTFLFGVSRSYHEFQVYRPDENGRLHPISQLPDLNGFTATGDGRIYVADGHRGVGELYRLKDDGTIGDPIRTGVAAAPGPGGSLLLLDVIDRASPSSTTEVTQIDVDTGVARSLVRGPDIQSPASLGPSNAVYFVAQRFRPGESTPPRLERVDLFTLRHDVVRELPEGSAAVDASPHSTMIAIFRMLDVDGRRHPDHLLLDLETGATTPLGAWRPLCWSPSGHRLLVADGDRLGAVEPGRAGVTDLGRAGVGDIVHCVWTPAA